MATNIKTVMTYPLNGSTTDFNIPFEYLARKFVQVTLIGVDRKVLVLNQEYRFATKAIISTTKAWGPADGYTSIEIRRYTSATERLVDFTDGSILRAYDLNISQIQTLHVAEEARDLTSDTIGVNNDGHLDARGRRIVNLADGVADGDAISVGQVKHMNQNSWQARNESLQFRNEAEAFKNESGTNAQNTLVWRKDSERFRNEAEQFRNQAENSKNSAANSQGAASASASASTQSASQSQQSNIESKAQADRSKTEADRAKTEADKLGNMNGFAAAIDSVVGTAITFKGTVVSGDNLVSKTGLIVERDGNIKHDLVIGNQLIVGAASFVVNSGDAQLRVPLYPWDRVDFRNDIEQHPKVDGSVQHFNQLYRLHITSQPMHVGNKQGLHMGWNESNGRGESNFINNQGGGDGGFVFRTVNNANSVEKGRVDFTQDGNIYASNIHTRGGARMEANANIVGNTLYSGNGYAYLAGDGNLGGGLWGGVGGSLWSCLNDRYQFAKPPAGVRLYTGRGGDYIEGNVDGNSVGFRWFSSDRRLKDDIKVVRDAGDMLNIIRSYIPVSYKYKDKTWTDNRGVEQTTVGKNSRAGFITQDLIRIWPEAVDVLSDGMQSPDPNQIIGGLMLLVKNLDQRVQELEKEKV